MDNNTKKNETVGFFQDMGQTDKPAFIKFWIIWSFAFIALSVYSIWQIYNMNIVTPPRFSKEKFPAQHASFRQGAVANGAMANLASAGTNAEEIRVFLIFIVIFSLPTSILTFLGLLDKLERYPEKAPAPPKSCPGSCPSTFNTTILSIGHFGAFVSWIFGQIFYFRCLPTTCNQSNYEIVTLVWIIAIYVQIFFMVMSGIASGCERKKGKDDL